MAPIGVHPLSGLVAERIRTRWPLGHFPRRAKVAAVLWAERLPLTRAVLIGVGEKWGHFGGLRGASGQVARWGSEQAPWREKRR
jgi:hypothetical protein